MRNDERCSYCSPWPNIALCPTKLPTSVVSFLGGCRLGSVERELLEMQDVVMEEITGFDSGCRSGGLHVCFHPPKRINGTDYGTTGVTDTGGMSPSVLTGTKSTDPEVDSLVRSAAPVMTEATTVATVATTMAIPADVSQDKSAPHPSVFCSSSSSEKTDRTLSLFTGMSGSGFDARSIRAEEAVGARLRWKSYVLSGCVQGFELTDGRLVCNLIDHFTPPAFFKTVRRMEHEQLFTEFNVSAARNLSLSSEAKEESAEVTQLHTQVSGLEATENSLRGEVASAKDHNVLLDLECNSLKLKVTGLESTIAERDHELSDLGASSSSLKSQNQSLVNQLSNNKDASTWDIMDLLRLDDAVAETLGMTDLQPDMIQLMVPVHHKQDRVIIGSQALSVALDICYGRVEKMERNLIERLPFLKDVFVSIDDPLSTEALIEPPAEVPATNVLSTVVIVPHTNPSVFVEDYNNPDSADVVSKNATLGSESEGKINASAGGGLTFSQLDDEARDAVL
ncbi:hypothetical protein Tco_0876928 [Tanacetum coccineum]|uniref:Uncharacterized protein n=1 Tax=Tanacetum coccineum TaxID=301880 RepID=A0ABQ5BWP0_9ASTR